MLHSTIRSRQPVERDPGLVPEPDYVSFSDISRFFRRHGLLIAVCFVLSAAVGVFLGMTAPVRYTARAQILIDPSATQLVRDAAAGPERLLDTAQVEGQIAVLRSETLAYSVIGRLGLTDDSEFQPSPPSALRRAIAAAKELAFGKAPPQPAPPPEAAAYAALRTALDGFLANLDVRRVGLSYAIDISYTSGDPDKAARIANAVADAYIQDQLQAITRAAQKSSEWLEARLAQLRDQLNASARQLEAFKTGRAPDLQSDARQVERPAGGPAIRPGLSDIGGRDGGNQPRQAAGGPMTLAELESTTDSNRKIYEAYQRAFTEAVQRQSFPVANARVITAASRPLSRSAPRPKLTVMFAALTGVLAGIALAFLRQASDPTIRSARQLRAKTGLRCLALTPRLAGLGGSRLAGRRSRAGRQPLGAADYNFRLALDMPFSPFSNALKTLRTAILHADPSHPMRAVGVTSSMPREGKSMLAGNLAALSSLSSSRTLIVDADVHNSTISRWFAPGARVGLQEVLAGAATLEEAVVRGGMMTPDVLPLAVNEDAAVSYELLASPAMRDLLAVLRERYDTIVVDLPPVNPVVDGVAIAALLDGVVIAAEWGRAPVELIAEVAGTLSIAAANVLGVAITKADAWAATVNWRKDWGYGYYPAAQGGAGRSR